MTANIHLSPHVGVVAWAYAQLSQQVSSESSPPTSSALTEECRETLVNVMASCVVSLNGEGCVTGRRFRSELNHYLVRYGSLEASAQYFDIRKGIDESLYQSIQRDFRTHPLDLSLVKSLADLRSFDAWTMRMDQLRSRTEYCDSCASDAMMFSLIYSAVTARKLLGADLEQGL